MRWRAETAGCEPNGGAPSRPEEGALQARHRGRRRDFQGPGAHQRPRGGPEDARADGLTTRLLGPEGPSRQPLTTPWPCPRWAMTDGARVARDRSWTPSCLASPIAGARTRTYRRPRRVG